jgi:glycosyltransferase involved in cell wall biosynthesis
MISVIIPAHNEEAVIDRCLASLTGGSNADELEILVVANGCTDATVNIVAQHPQVRLVEVGVASKHAALNAGDAAASHFPRAFVDADIEVDPGALLAVSRALADAGAYVGAPAARVDLTGCSWAVRAYYRISLRLAWSTDAPVGTGVYVLSRAGHARLGRFPDIINDDQYVHDMFRPEERVCVTEHEFIIRPARNLRALVMRRTRQLEGGAEFQARFGALPGHASGPGAIELLRADPRGAIDLVVFAAVKVAAMWRLRRKRRLGRTGWERDDSSRGALGTQ